MNNFCIGTANWQQGYGVDVSFSDCKEIINCAKTNKIIYMDTAQSYSGIESILGNIGILNFNVITKLPHDYKHSNFDTLLRTFRLSLHKLNASCIYGLLSHREDIENHDKFWADLHKLKQEGFVKNIGVSVYAPGKAKIYAIHPCIDIIQVPFNMLDCRLLDNNFFKLAQKKQIFIRSIFLRGALLMSEQLLKENKLSWLRKYLNQYYKFLEDYQLKPYIFCLIGAINTIKKLHPWAIFIIGVDNVQQLMYNINAIKSTGIPKYIFKEWWNNLPVLPEKVLNPSLWSKV